MILFNRSKMMTSRTLVNKLFITQYLIIIKFMSRKTWNQSIVHKNGKNYLNLDCFLSFPTNDNTLK